MVVPLLYRFGMYCHFQSANCICCMYETGSPVHLYAAGKAARLTYSLAYSPPETLKDFNDGERTVVADPSVDMWAVGIIAYELITGKPSFPFANWK